MYNKIVLYNYFLNLTFNKRKFNTNVTGIRKSVKQDPQIQNRISIIVFVKDKKKAELFNLQ